MEIFYRTKIILAISLFLLPKLITFTHLIHHLLSYEYYNNNKSGNMVPRKCRTDTDRKKSCIRCITESVSPTLKEKIIANSVPKRS
jgi:Ser-tRNA(Ala) deacylase AlaX